MLGKYTWYAKQGISHYHDIIGINIKFVLKVVIEYIIVAQKMAVLTAAKAVTIRHVILMVLINIIGV